MNYLKPLVITVVITLNIVCNGLVIAVFAKNPQLREDPTNLFMLSLTLSDVITGLTAMPISAVLCSSSTSSSRDIVRYMLSAQLSCLRMCGFTSLHSLCWVTVCKMVAITKPFRYQQLFTKTRCYILVAFIWTSGCAIALVGSRGSVTWNQVLCTGQPAGEAMSSGAVRLVFMVGLALALVGIVYATSRIFCAIVRTHLQITAQVHSMGGHGGTCGPTPSLTLQSVRSGRNILLICAGVLLLTIPAIVYTGGVFIWGIHSISSSYGFVACWIAMCNSFVNSLLYLVLFRSVRHKAAKMLKGLFACCRVQ